MAAKHPESGVAPRPTANDAARGEHALLAGGLSPARMKRMHDVLRRHVESGQLPGLVALLSRRDGEHADAIGTLAFGSGAPMRRDTIFRLASNTKLVTAVAGMILVEECKLRLDDPVDEWLPELRARRVLRTPASPLDDTVPAKRSITVRDLFTFRSGYGEVSFVSGDCPMQRALAEARLPLSVFLFEGTSDELMKRLGALPLVDQPGERWLYHMSAEILGVLIARVAGKSLGAFMRERIFEPLGMKDTGFSVPEDELDRLATWYRSDPSTGQLVVADEARGGLFARPPAFESGGGGLASTVDDLHAFCRMMLGGGACGAERILSRPAVELMTTDHLTPEEKRRSPFFLDLWQSFGWGLGVAIKTRRHELARRPGSFGWDGAFGTSCWIDPSEQLIGILLTQRSPETLKIPAVVEDFWTSAYQAIDD